MERVAYAFHVVSDQETDVRAVAADLRGSFEDFARTRQELGLTSLSVWLQSTSHGPLVVMIFEGRLQEYFRDAVVDSGIDEWFREKIRQWTGSDDETQRVYSYPQSEELFSWSLEA